VSGCGKSVARQGDERVWRVHRKYRGRGNHGRLPMRGGGVQIDMEGREYKEQEQEQE